MQNNRLIRISKRFFELGLNQSLIIAKERYNNYLFTKQWQDKAAKKLAAHEWRTITPLIEFSEFFHAACKRSLPTSGFTNNPAIIDKANQYTNNTFDLLGSGKQTFSLLPWHEDFRLKTQQPESDYSFDSTHYYKSITIEVGKTKHLIKDIKVPWELSRFQHVPVLGKAYTITTGSLYADTFMNHTLDWISKNPYLIGINWLCPMEVSIRAINWIWGFNYFKRSTQVSESFWQPFICSLYDHMHYLENNWEIFDGKTSNHYLSDLIGYFYLCWFFQDLPNMQKKMNWCVQELLQECDKQVFQEGTDYESSTAYHSLVTEIFSHFYMLAQVQGLDIPASFSAKLERMREFKELCKISEHDSIKIGDNDSGVILETLISLPNNTNKSGGMNAITHYPSFGITILKTESLHFTLRHHSFMPQQPTAHMHNDALSITLARNGIPLFVDPGTFVYTPSEYWRNYFRSASVHNTFFIKDTEPVVFDNRLFALNMPTHDQKSIVINYEKKCLTAQHLLYARYNLIASRTAKINDNYVELHDMWKPISALHDIPEFQTCWNFTLNPEIHAIQHNQSWQLLYKDYRVATLQSSLDFTITQTWVSTHYGTKEQAISLTAQKKINVHESTPIVIIF